MATVYLAHDLKLDREVALKVLRPELGAGRRLSARAGGTDNRHEAKDRLPPHGPR